MNAIDLPIQYPWSWQILAEKADPGDLGNNGKANP